MKNYYRVMLGRKSIYAEECFTSNFIGTDFGVNQDLTNKLPPLPSPSMGFEFQSAWEESGRAFRIIDARGAKRAS